MSEYHVHDERGFPGDVRYTVCRGQILSDGRCSSACKVVGVADTLWGAKRVARKHRKKQVVPFYKLPAKELDLD